MSGCECKPDAKRKRDSAQPQDARRKRDSAQPQDAKRKRDSAQPQDAKRKRDSAQPQEMTRLIQALSGVSLPYIRVDWFIANASTPPLYHTILRLPGTLEDVERLLDVHATFDLE